MKSDQNEILEQDLKRQLASVEQRLATIESEEKAREQASLEFVQRMQNNIRTEPYEFVEWVCELVLGEEEWVKVNLSSWPLAEVERYQKVCSSYRYFANQILNSRKKLPKPVLSGYVSLREVIEDGCSWIEFHTPEVFDSPEYIHIFADFFPRYLDGFNSQIYYLTYMIYFGVPLFEKINNEFQVVDERNEDYLYLKQRGKYEDTTSTYQMPTWADKYYFNSEHIDLYLKMDWDEYKSEDERNFVREHYRKMIGVPLSNNQSPAFGETSRLHKLMQKVIDRYYGSNFDPNDSDTWPRQVDIVDWLQSEHALSKREAEAIDIVTRPDRARNK